MPSAGEESPNLDLLRSVAVLLVLVDHLLLFLGLVGEGDLFRPIGHFGVLLFFVHTSLVLMLSLERQQAHQYRHPFVVFWLRRAFRILPLSLLTVAVVAACRLPLGHFEARAFLPAQFDAGTIASNALLIQNLTGHESLLEPLWSLPFEVQMYLALPALFALCCFIKPVSATPSLKQAIPLVFLWAAAALAIDRVVRPHLGTELLDYVPCFLAGIFAYLLWSTPRRLPAWGWPVWLGLVALGYLLHPGMKTGWLCCLCIGAGVTFFREQSFVPLRRASAWLARYSYGIYLSHGLCLWLTLDRLSAWPAGLRWPLLVALIVLVPVALYHAVEAPMIRWGRTLLAERATRHARAAGPVAAPASRIAA